MGHLEEINDVLMRSQKAKEGHVLKEKGVAPGPNLALDDLNSSTTENQAWAPVTMGTG